MPITIPDDTAVRVAYDYAPAIPGVLSTELEAPGPLSVDDATHPSGMATFEPSIGANNGAFIGFGLVPTSVGRAVGALRATVIAGFAGVEPGELVFLDAADGSLTHTALNNGEAVGKGYTAEMIYFF